MNKDEARLAVMGAISMALKDPTLQQGFEIICKENAEFKEQLYAFDEEREKLRKENAELKADNDARKFAMAMSEKVEKQLREENEKLKTDYEVLSCSVGDFGELQDRLEEEQRKNNGLEEELKKWKDEWQEQVQKATDEGYARTLQTMQLTKAIEIIKKYLAIGVGGKITQNYLDVTKEAEQFLNGEADESKN